MGKVKKEGSSLRIAFFFSIFIGLLLVISFSIKMVTLLVQSRFDAQHRFTIALDHQSAPGVDVISIAPDANTISIVVLNGKIQANTTQKYLGIPIDATLQVDEEFSEINTNVSGAFQSFLFRYPLLAVKNMTYIDMLRLWLAVKSIPTHSITVEELDVYPRVTTERELLIDAFSAQYFTDYTLSSEKLSMQIINASGVPGVGNLYGRMLANSGANVVSVTTGDEIEENSSIVYSGEKSYTIERLQKLVGGKAIPLQKTGISDIILTIGKESAK